MKHPFFLGWILLTCGTLAFSNARGWRMLPGSGLKSRASSSSSSSTSVFGWRSFGGGSFHK